MHVGNIDGDTAAGRVYRTLLALDGRWMGGWELTLAAKVTAVSTRKSEIKKQLEALGRDERIEHKQNGLNHYYRIVRTGAGEQMEIAV